MRYLACGDNYHSKMYAWRVPYNTICLFIPEVCNAIVEAYTDKVIACPKTPQEWQLIADQFAKRWNFHNCVGAIDGKHVALTCPPPKGGSIFYNYKGFHSIILMALVNADYKFSWVDVGRDGSSGGGQVFNASELKAAIDNGSVGFPEATSLPHDDKPIPYCIVGDDAFTLWTWLMKPYSKRHMTLAERIFNYRLSRGCGKCLLDPSPQVPESFGNHEAETMYRDIGCVGVCVPAQSDETQVSPGPEQGHGLG